MCALLAGLALSTAAETEASEFNYNLLEVAVTPDAIDGADPTMSLSGSYNINQNFSVVGDYSRTTLAESNGIELEFINFNFGAAYHQPVMYKTDMVADVRYVSTEIVISKGSRSASLGEGTGYTAGVGLRHQYTDQIEARTSLHYLSVEDATDTAISVGGMYHFNNQFSAGVDYITGDFDGIRGSVRMNF